MVSIPPTGKNQTGTVIFFHGSVDTGQGQQEVLRSLLGKDLDFPHLKVIIPTAPVQPYTPLDGQLSNVWFDRAATSIESKEQTTSLESIYKVAKEMIQKEVDDGIPESRIIVGGFSMGGALALHIAYHLNTKIAGAFACSSFLNRDSAVYDSLQKRQNANEKLPTLLMFHGDRDNLIPSAWGQETFNTLTRLGVKGELRIVKDASHDLKKNELLELEDWINRMLPVEQDDAQNKM